MSALNSGRPVFIDTHCHVDLFPNPSALVRTLDQHQVQTIAVTNAPSVFEHTEGLARLSPFLLPAVGLHPELVATHERELDRFWPYLERTRFVGEVGLDYSTPDQSVRARQRRVFSTILERCARYGNKVITVHSRRAAFDVLAAIGDNFQGEVILHWFTGTQRELDRALHTRCYFSVNLAMLQSEKGRKLIMAIPRERILTESDAPFVRSPDHAQGPLSVASSVALLAKLWNTSPEDAALSIATTFRRHILHQDIADPTSM